MPPTKGRFLIPPRWRKKRRNPIVLQSLMQQSEHKRLVVDQIDADDEQAAVICNRLVSKLSNACDSVTSVSLYLNSEIHEYFCGSTALFKALSACAYLKELTLMLSQMKLDVVNRGLIQLGLKVPYMRKLCLINCVASFRTMQLIAQEFCYLESAGFINCWYVDDEGLAELFEGCTNLSTLNVSYCKLVTAKSLSRMITTCTEARKPFKFYTKYSGVVYADFDFIRCVYPGRRILFKDYLALRDDEDASSTASSVTSSNEAYVLEYLEEKRRKVSRKDLASEVPADWEYDSDVDFDADLEEN